jgi:flagellar basal-body rod protein FlgB
MRVFVRDDMTTILSKTMDGLSLRYQVIADNIANVDTPGFKAKDVRFEDELSSAIVRGKSGSAKPAIYECQGKTRFDGNSVDIHMETAKMAETTVLYAAMSRLISERFSLLRSVITEGRR